MNTLLLNTPLKRPVLGTIALSAFLMLLLGESFSQGFYNRNAWKRTRHEFNFNVGASNFLGDIGGRDQVGSNFVWDLEFSQTKLVGGINYQYYLSEKVCLRTSLIAAKVGGNDNLTQEFFRNNRNLNFQSWIFEGGLGIEYQFLKEQIGNIYNIKSPTGKKLGMKSFATGFYVTTGIAGFYYNPKAIAPDGRLVALKPLSTEGQGLPGGAKSYSNYSIAIPFGFGLRRSINRTMGIKLELTHRFTFTDYIDDVSTVYYDPAVLAAERGSDAVYFANPELGNAFALTTKPGQQRGDATDKDGYMFLTASFYVKLETKQSLYGRNRVRRVKASF